MKRLQFIPHHLSLLTAGLMIGLATITTAQTKDTTSYSFSLQQAIDYAMKNHTAVQNAAYDEQIADQKVKETIGIGLPQITGGVSVQDFIEIPTSVFPGNAFNPFANPDSLTAVKF